MSKKAKEIVNALSAEAMQTYGELTAAIMDAATSAQIGAIITELDGEKLTQLLGADAIELLRRQARMAAADFRYLSER